MILYGASGHAKVICSCLESLDIKVLGIFDDDLQKKQLDHYQVLGKYEQNLLRYEKMIISIGDNLIRKEISKKISHKFGKIIHKLSLVDDLVQIGEGTVVLHNSVIQRGSSIGSHVIVNTSASIDHDCQIDNFVHVSPQVALGGNVNIGVGTHIGIGASVIQGMTIGKWAVIGAGTVIIEDVPDYAVVVGNPGRIIKYKRPSDEE